MQTHITLTSKIGNFTFDKDVALAKAKLIRDSIVGQFFCPKPHESAIKTEEDAYLYVQTRLGRDLEEIPFELSIVV